MKTFVLVNPLDDGTILASEKRVDDLPYWAVENLNLYDICVRFETEENRGGPCVPIARVNGVGSPYMKERWERVFEMVITELMGFDLEATFEDDMSTDHLTISVDQFHTTFIYKTPEVLAFPEDDY
jgi:hypothetical protein